MARHHEWWYIRRLQTYYNEHYLNYDEEVEWYGNPEPNKWRFVIKKLGLNILLTCDDDGNITEVRSKYEG